MGFMEYRIDWEREMEHWVCFDLNLFIFGGFFFFRPLRLIVFRCRFLCITLFLWTLGGSSSYDRPLFWPLVLASGPSLIHLGRGIIYFVRD